MNRPAVIRAAFFAVLAMDNKPSRRTVEKMIRQITGGVGFSSAEVCAWFKANPQYQLSYAQSPEPLQNHPRTTSEPPSEPVDKHNSSVAQNHQENQAQNPSRVRAVKVLVKANRKDGVIPPVANATVPPPKQEAPKSVSVGVPEVTFEPEDEQRVQALLALEVVGDKVRAKTRLAKRFAMRSKLESSGPDAWRYAMDTAISKPAGWQYALAVLKSNPKGPPSASPRPASRGAPERFVPKNLRADDNLLAKLDQIGRQNAI